MKKFFIMAIVAIATLLFVSANAMAETGTFVELENNPGVQFPAQANLCITGFNKNGGSAEFTVNYLFKFGGCARGSRNLSAFGANQNDSSLVILTKSRFFAENRSVNPIYQANMANQQILANQQYQISRDQAVSLCKARVLDRNNKSRNCGGTVEMVKTVLIYTKEGAYDVKQDRLYQAAADAAKMFACPKQVDPYYCEADPTLFLK